MARPERAKEQCKLLEDRINSGGLLRGKLHEIFGFTTSYQKRLLRALAAREEIVRAAQHSGPRESSFAHNAASALYSLDDQLPTGHRHLLGKLLAPFRPQLIPPVPRGCRITPLPDLSQWYGRHSFLSNLESVGDCLEWQAGTTGQGYGRVKVYGKLYSTHRVAYTLANGPIPVGKGHHGVVVRHTCDNPRCCKPEHLVLGSQRDNVRDMLARGRERRPAPSPTLLSAGGV